MDPRDVLLDHSAPIPVDRPFHRREAAAEGVPDRQLAAWCRDGLLLHPVRGVYHAAQLPAGIDLRLACLRLVVPEDAVVTDRTAGWLYGATMVLAPNDHLAVPQLSLFRPPGYRLRNGLVISGERSFLDDEVVELGGVRVTSALRTTCDLGRLRHRERAFCAMEAMAGTGLVDLDELAQLAASTRFRGYRWVTNLRDLAPRVEGRTQSAPEAIILLRWTDCPDLPRPRPQVRVPAPRGRFYYVDVGVEALRYGAEYDGAAWHGPERRQRDADRRGYMTQEHQWSFDIFVQVDLFGRGANVERRLHEGVRLQRRVLGERAWRSLAQ
jgi:hypothetical protein